MEFHEKLQELRKNRGLTQEELAAALYVSRTAVSKWESGRGYPGIESLKSLSAYFSVTIDDLLSGDKLIYLAESEHQAKVRAMRDRLFGVADLLAILPLVLPLYPKTVADYVYSVNLWLYTETAHYNRVVYWCLFLALIACGIWKLLWTRLKPEAGSRMTTDCSLLLSAVASLYLVLAGEAYAAAVIILLLLIKGWLLLRCGRTNPG